jgi:hypothetical protein
MFVLEALVLTFMTTPLVVAFYPQKYRVHAAATGANFNNVPGAEMGRERSIEEEGTRTFSSVFTVVLDKMEVSSSLWNSDWYLLTDSPAPSRYDGYDPASSTKTIHRSPHPPPSSAPIYHIFS